MSTVMRLLEMSSVMRLLEIAHQEHQYQALPLHEQFVCILSDDLNRCGFLQRRMGRHDVGRKKIFSMLAKLWRQRDFSFTGRKKTSDVVGRMKFFRSDSTVSS